MTLQDVANHHRGEATKRNVYNRMWHKKAAELIEAEIEKITRTTCAPAKRAVR